MIRIRAEERRAERQASNIPRGVSTSADTGVNRPSSSVEEPRSRPNIPRSTAQQERIKRKRAKWLQIKSLKKAAKQVEALSLSASPEVPRHTQGPTIGGGDSSPQLPSNPPVAEATIMSPLTLEALRVLGSPPLVITGSTANGSSITFGSLPPFNLDDINIEHILLGEPDN